MDKSNSLKVFFNKSNREEMSLFSSIETNFESITLLLCELFISGYHTLSTFGIIEYTGCESATLPTDINQLKEALLNDKLVVTCSNANLKFFGIPLSFYNTLFSTFFLLIIILNAYKKKK